MVWGSQNQPIAKSDGTEVKAKAETPESNPEKVVSATEVKKQTQSNKTENKKDTNKNTSSSSGSKNHPIPIIIIFRSRRPSSMMQLVITKRYG